MDTPKKRFLVLILCFLMSACGGETSGEAINPTAEANHILDSDLGPVGCPDGTNLMFTYIRRDGVPQDILSEYQRYVISRSPIVQ